MAARPPRARDQAPRGGRGAPRPPGLGAGCAEEIIDEGWFGPTVTADAASRLGDVALVAKGTIAFSEPTDTGPYHLVGRHGSATSAELYVPLLAALA